MEPKEPLYIESVTMPYGETYRDVEIHFERFMSDGSTVIRMMLQNGEVLATPSVNLSEYGIYPRNENETFIKEYSEGEGMTDLLVKHNIVERTGTVAEFGPFGTKAELVRIK